jgi:hypothetical protein
MTPYIDVSIAQRLFQKAGRSYVVLSGALSRSYGRIVAEVSLDVGHDDMAVDAVSRHKPLPGDVARHGGRRAQWRQVGKWGVCAAATLWVSMLMFGGRIVGCIVCEAC